MAPYDKENQSVKTARVRSERPCCDCLWLFTTCEGILKLLELLATFLSFVIICAGLDASKYKLDPQYEFMVFVGITAWVFVALHVILRVSHLFEKLPNILLHPIIGMVLCGIATVTFIVASSVVYGYSYGWKTLLAGAGCGYVSAVLFLFEVIFLYVRYKRGARPAQRQQTASASSSQPTKPSETAEKEAKKTEEPKSAEELGFPP